MKEIGVLMGGLDSAVLAAEYARRGHRVHPIYIAEGFRWEAEEQRALKRFLHALPTRARFAPLQVLHLPMATVYPRHWSLTRGLKVPGRRSPDHAVYLPGRNLGLTLLAGLYCVTHQIPQLILGLLSSNPFPDSRPAFLRSVKHALRLGTGRTVSLSTPFARLTKARVIIIGKRLPLHLTLSCLNPREGRHCGRCNKCRERQEGFRLAGVPDHTRYASR